MKKKLLSIALIGAFLLANTGLITAATLSGDNATTTTTYSEEKDLNKLYERAQNSISDIKEKGNSKVVLTDPITNEKLEVDTISTTQLVKSVNNTENKAEDVNTYVTTSFAIIKNSDFETTEKQPPSVMATPTWEDAGYGDESKEVKAYIAIKYELQTYDTTFRQMRIMNQSGGWMPGQCQVLNPRVYTNLQGLKYNSIIPKTLNYEIWPPYGALTFNQAYSNEDWVYGNPGLFDMKVSANMLCKVIRGGTSWNFDWTTSTTLGS